MRFVLDGSPWSFFSPFLDFSGTFCKRAVAASWNIAAKYPYGELLFFLLHKENVGETEAWPSMTEQEGQGCNMSANLGANWDKTPETVGPFWRWT